MPKNLTGVQAGTVQTDEVNNPSVRVIRGKNQFPQSYMHLTTNRYGEVDPVFVFKGIRGDVIPYSFECDLNTFTMQSPIKSKVRQHTACFKVPMEAIYPRNWRDVMFPIPNKGDDEPSNCRALFPIGSFVRKVFSFYVRSVQDSSLDDVERINVFIRSIFLLESVFSAGSLFSKMNMHFDSIKFAGTTIDKFIDIFISSSLKDVFLSPLEDEDLPSYVVNNDMSGRYENTDRFYISIRRAIELLRDGSYYISRVTNLALSGNILSSDIDFIVSSLPDYVNIEPIIAYQLACSHFFSNSKVDFVYSAQLYRDNMQSILYGSTGRVPTFNWNGIIKQYDVFSLQCFSDALNIDISSVTAFDDYLRLSSYWLNLFTFQRSLRYGDYFTSAHVEPIAPGDINAPVIDGSVNAIDMTKKLQAARLLNKINIVGQRFEDQLRALFGGSIPEAPKDVPIKLSEETFGIEGFEVNNTGQDQLSDSSPNITTTNLRMNKSKFMFEVAIDEPCWLVGVQYYSVERIYSKTLSRFAFHQDRYDDFIPDLQFEGDQDIYAREIDATRHDAYDDLTPYAYVLRYMEYKNAYSYASGGFINDLPSWAMITDNADGNPTGVHINPDYIRSSPSEFDRFFKILNGYSLGTYYHFIVSNTNYLAPYRQMVYAPEILA